MKESQVNKLCCITKCILLSLERTILILHSTALSQQSSSTCDGLDRLIANSNSEFTGSCSRNDDCNMVNCIPRGAQSITVTFPQSPDSACSVRSMAAVDGINFDETATESELRMCRWRRERFQLV